jgi:hypothetical protein
MINFVSVIFAVVAFLTKFANVTFINKELVMTPFMKE